MEQQAAARQNVQQAHTPEPWDLQNKGNLYGKSARVVIVARENVGATLPTISKMEDLSAESYANAHRIVACVNGCKGINPEAVRDLLEALQTAHQALGESRGYHQSTTAIKIRAAIAKAEVTP